jgi:putative glycosyltransferase (TIGR04372 family)
MEYWRRYLPDMITDPVAIELLSPLAKYLEDHLFAVMDASGKQICEFFIAERAIQAQWEEEGRSHLLTLSDSDHERGWRCLRGLGVPADAWFVGLHVREGRVKGARNADINTYSLAMESIVARGGWVIRMGDPSMTPLPPMPQVIDYAHGQVRSDWMDVFLWAQCRFFIGTQSGPLMVPPTFGVPCVLTNSSSLGLRLWFNKDLCIFKLFWSKSEARYLNFAELVASALGWVESAKYLASQGIKLVDNTPKEINEVVIEMLDRLEGKLSYSREDEELQERFDSLYTSNASKANARIGQDFLRKWAHLL